MVPMKIRAGWKFQGRKPASEPASTAHRRAISGWSMPAVSGDDAERERGDERDAGREAVEPVDEVDAVDHAHDPEHREDDGERLGEDG